MPAFALFPRLDHLRWFFEGGRQKVVLVWEILGPFTLDLEKLR